jgi:GNAT superfamily N-acetyltransferase
VVDFALAGPEHLDGIIDLLRDDHLGRNRESLDVGEYREAFDEISKDRNQYLVVGLDGGEVVATLQLSVMPSLSRVGTKRGQIEGVRVAADRRGEGVGTALIEWTIQLARYKGCGMVQLTTDHRRPESVAFYELLGFVNSHHGLKLVLDP